MVKRVGDRTNGAVKITLFPNNALGSPVETAQQTKLGAIDMILMNPANIESFSKAVGVINIPYQFDSYEHAHRTLDVTARDWISQQLATGPASSGSPTSNGASGRFPTASAQSIRRTM